ncbi:MAG: NAD(P)/FAD-dependent oxidoreductase [Pirellulaceae bacterium]
MNEQIAVIIGAGPAGLTAACELLHRTGIRPIVLEKSSDAGGLSRTVNYKGNRIDIGGHRFFSKADRVMNWWLQRMPLEASAEAAGLQMIHYHGQDRQVERGRPGLDPAQSDQVMLVRPRRSRIYFERKFFDYPIRLSVDTVQKLGFARMAKIGASYARAAACPIRNEATLEDFFINRFGRELYRTFFESYTEKVWGRPCTEISAEWGVQRIKGLSIGKAILHAISKPFQQGGRCDVAQKQTETSLIEQFLYPKFGPGQMWELAAEEIERLGGRVIRNHEVRHILTAGERVLAVEAVDVVTGRPQTIAADYFFSTMPVKQLVRAISDPPPASLRRTSEGLIYRDFITVGLLLDELAVKEQGGLIRDNWIYIQESDVRVGRMQIYNNWSPHLVADRSKVWIGLEYFCNENDDLWVQNDRQIVELAKAEMAKIGILNPAAVRDATVIRVPKTYPAYFGTYDRFDDLRDWLDRFENLLLVGRNGMHRYNNMDHSMLTAMVAVDNIIEGRTDKSNIWAVNTEQEYHEVEKTVAAAPAEVKNASTCPSVPASEDPVSVP